MKRFLFVLLSVAAILFGAQKADAGKWVTDEIKWQLTNQGGVGGTSIWTRDTTFNVIAAGQTDTTMFFSGLSKADVWRDGHAGAATTVDTVIVGFLVFQQDSLGVAASTLTSLTVEIDGRAGGFNGPNKLNGWVQIDSLVVTGYGAGNGTDGPANVYSVPIRAINGLGYPIAANSGNLHYRMMAYDNLRARITAATGVMSAARVFLRYYTKD